VPLVLGAAAAAVLLGAPSARPVRGAATEVTVGSQDAWFGRNKQNEPAVAIDASRPNIVAAGANDSIDVELCNAGEDTTCPFTPNVGVSGVQFSFDSGRSWRQPTYRGISARHCSGVPGPEPVCEPNPNGPIGTVPRYEEVGLVSNGDPALAFGPRPGSDGRFSWSNGSRLYYAGMAANVAADVGEAGIKGPGAIAVSRTDDVARAAAGDNRAWMRPVIASRESTARFADKERIWADNAASSRFFGSVYVCYAAFRANGSAPLAVSRSADGGSTWSTTNVAGASAASKPRAGQSGCTIRTDSTGVAYVFFQALTSPDPAGLPTAGRHMLVKSADGGRSFTKAVEVQRGVNPCHFTDPVIGRCVMDGVAGARSDLSASPGVDIANGAPSGTDASNLIVDTWATAARPRTRRSSSSATPAPPASRAPGPRRDPSASRATAATTPRRRCRRTVGTSTSSTTRSEPRSRARPSRRGRSWASCGTPTWARPAGQGRSRRCSPA
jgi:hypothetical protein